MKNLYRILLCLILISLPEVLSAADLRASDLLAEARDAFYRSDTKHAESLIRALEQFLDTAAAPVSEEEYILQSKLFLYKGLLELDLNKTGVSSATLKKGIDLCFQGAERYGTEALLSLTALLKSQWMLLQNTGTIIKTGGEVQDLSDRALEMNPKSALALLLSAQGLVNAPRLFGGNPEKAIDLLLNSKFLFLEPYEKFNLYLTLASAYRKKKEWQEGEKWCRMALSLYPENRQGREMLVSLMNREKS